MMKHITTVAFGYIGLTVTLFLIGGTLSSCKGKNSKTYPYSMVPPEFHGELSEAISTRKSYFIWTEIPEVTELHRKLFPVPYGGKQYFHALTFSFVCLQDTGPRPASSVMEIMAVSKESGKLSEFRTFGEFFSPLRSGQWDGAWFSEPEWIFEGEGQMKLYLIEVRSEQPENSDPISNTLLFNVRFLGEQD